MSVYFLWQVLTGVNISSPSLVDAIHWGADYAPLTFLEEPTRLFTSMFFHFGFIHLMLNMWALYIFGSVAEQLAQWLDRHSKHLRTTSKPKP